MDKSKEQIKPTTKNESILVNIVGYTLVLCFILVVTYSTWWFSREMNASLYYDNATLEIICDVIKPEYIKDGKCN